MQFTSLDMNLMRYMYEKTDDNTYTVAQVNRYLYLMHLVPENLES